ncbi:MAG TPA: hypothetical protein VHE33_18740 [Acidobacteriaceae bacterium]|nr:hypothetical protein [Acidobacteriaceae bacterium]
MFVVDRYDGQNSLARFVLAAARQIALRTGTDAERFHGEAALVAYLSQVDDQGTRFWTVCDRTTLNRALSIALRSLTPRERLILRLNLLERISTARIADLYRVSPPTVLQSMRRSARKILIGVQDLVCDQLPIDPRELDTFMLPLSRHIEHVMQADLTISF